MKNQLKLLISISLISITTWSINSYAHSEHFTKSTRSAEQSYDFRSSTMKIYKWYLSPMGAMVKGKTKFDSKAFAEYAAGLEAITKLSLLEGFPKDSSEDEVDDSDAKVEIWSNGEDFEKNSNPCKAKLKNWLQSPSKEMRKR